MLEISGIYKSYHRQNILAGVDLTVAPGECVGIVGYNGCGKTTLLSILAGAQKADRGSILYNGREGMQPSIQRRGSVGPSAGIRGGGGLCASGESAYGGTDCKG